VQGVSSIVWLAPVPYYATLDGGPVSFTINLWFKAGNTTGGLFQYLFSHMGDPDGSEWGPNQVTANMAAQHDMICTGVTCHTCRIVADLRFMLDLHGEQGLHAMHRMFDDM